MGEALGANPTTVNTTSAVVGTSNGITILECRHNVLTQLVWLQAVQWRDSPKDFDRVEVPPSRVQSVVTVVRFTKVFVVHFNFASQHLEDKVVWAVRVRHLAGVLCKFLHVWVIILADQE